MVVSEKKTMPLAAAYCASKEGTLSEKKSDGVAIAKEKGVEHIWFGPINDKFMYNPDVKKSFVCEAMCNEGKLLNCWMVIDYREYY